jgi:tRNA-(ms[2]io[6]A)-hydroxylase
MLRLRIPTPPAWTRHVLANFDEFLRDHANCERKASATAMAFVVHYPDRAEIIPAMVELAREELDHFRQVYERMVERGLSLARDTKDPYVARLNAALRSGRDVYLLDRLLVSGIVEARGCERLGLVAEALEPGPLKDFYAELTRAEARHHGLFVRLARVYFDEATVERRLGELLSIEERAIAELPIRAAVH